MVNRIARALRKRPTNSERLLWDELKLLRHQGYHFRRQVPLEGFIVDFACLSQLVVVEVDGAHHGEGNQAAMDKARDGRLQQKGFSIVRVTNTDVIDNMDGAMHAVLVALGATEGSA
ncbi:MAG: endonuclease domain-containing protein [Hyphomicrobiaceae bacterium]